MSGSTCSFNQGGTSVAVFCENGCCDNECCSDSDIDEDALFISLAVILGLLILLALLILLLYCCCKRKQDKKKNRVASVSSLGGGKDSVLGNGYFTASKLVQTSDHEATPRDHILWGRASRWSSTPNDKQGYRRRSKIWTVNPVDRSVQTGDGFTSTSTSVQTNRRFIPTPRAAPKPWAYSQQEKSLEKSRPKPLDTHKNMAATELGPYYPVHHHPGINRLNTSDREAGSGISPSPYDYNDIGL